MIDIHEAHHHGVQTQKKKPFSTFGKEQNFGLSRCEPRLSWVSATLPPPKTDRRWGSARQIFFPGADHRPPSLDIVVSCCKIQTAWKRQAESEKQFRHKRASTRDAAMQVELSSSSPAPVPYREQYAVIEEEACLLR